MMPKFRVFIKETITETETDEMKNVILISFKSKLVRTNDEKWYGFEDAVLMQSTGLHDKNGVEIYEGDLIHYTYEGFDWYVPVVYREGSFEVYHGTLSTIPASKIPSGKYTTYIGNSISMYRDEFTDMYVAGNIYENPELLEVTK